ncbi:Gp15 family bacteriophage protein [Eubacterium sp.]|uniref:Gp15 family bacteriophage protein n=1 Tax=Eubacterium sp. TaxID=142586 RepID=UPI002607E96B|nr:Gp15 family bacteriophage protein [uncultured Eubacterium sp.]MEE0716110.1 Gp15 family bacteriophage protein [Eubacterium sp.]
MIGELPQSIEVGGVNQPIRTDFRDILTIFEAFNDSELSQEEKVMVCLRIMYVDLDKMDTSLYMEAYEKAVKFINVGQEDKRENNSPKLMDWEQDEQLVFAAINKVAGTEVRTFEYMHWWTLMGYYMGIGESLFADVVNIRTKKLNHKKLEKYEQDFYKKNKDLVDLKTRYTKEELEEREEVKKLLGL